MIESTIVLTPLHYAYLIGVIVILAVMVMRRDTPAVCIESHLGTSDGKRPEGPPLWSCDIMRY